MRDSSGQGSSGREDGGEGHLGAREIGVRG